MCPKNVMNGRRDLPNLHKNVHKIYKMRGKFNLSGLIPWMLASQKRNYLLQSSMELSVEGSCDLGQLQVLNFGLPVLTPKEQLLLRTAMNVSWLGRAGVHVLPVKLLLNLCSNSTGKGLDFVLCSLKATELRGSRFLPRPLHLALVDICVLP